MVKKNQVSFAVIVISLYSVDWLHVLLLVLPFGCIKLED